MNPLPRIAVTMGDPAGVGPELCLRLLQNEELAREVTPIIFGDAGVLQRVAAHLGWTFNAPVITTAEWPEKHRTITVPAVLDLQCVTAVDVIPCRVNANTGHAAYQYLDRAIAAGLAGEIAGICTGPINKAALHAAGHHYPGHTEILAERMQVDRWCMMLTSPEITCSFVTAHVGYHEVPQLLTSERILEVIELTHAAMRRLREREPKLVCCGLNPHAGEDGLFGNREEERIIAPALAMARAKGIQIEGPLPPDTCFLTWRRAATDAYICMYHDQGHIPLKALAFDTAINTTLGLPVIRTSVDHGTAFDIAWQGIAGPSSLFAAVRLAAKLAVQPH
ncbi:4-hydroxythreonine-4-phosphate dehydrogenase [Anatilimnocola aggregata]|uniref:4-hydroxythreonine-4-phosphate dehydrogenase n=1 Tax=Anatilimnocola aggregata TaxID=2528021 RepID=A0A517YBB9_9BACT|nr:4-hydroxythreonine-4-phosphate dehydrogenase PdxA [Anatilimnocola aggregata]QDU27553.1 4-hydroxythreonine-4-phosphate dehydrogenase [Anatilimnocola aggregata]